MTSHSRMSGSVDKCFTLVYINHMLCLLNVILRWWQRLFIVCPNTFCFLKQQSTNFYQGMLSPRLNDCLSSLLIARCVHVIECCLTRYKWKCYISTWVFLYYLSAYRSTSFHLWEKCSRNLPLNLLLNIKPYMPDQ